MPSRFYPNDYGSVLYSDMVVWQRLGNSASEFPDTSIGVGDEPDIQQFTYNVADLNGKTVYSPVEYAISRYKYYYEELTFALLDTEYSLLVAPLYGVIRVWANASGVKFYINNVEHVADAPISEIDAIPIQVLQGDEVTVAASIAGREGYMTFLPYVHPIP